MQARAGAGFVEHVHGALLEHAGADAPQHVLGRVPLDDHVVDAGARQQRPSSRPDGPAPMIATWVRMSVSSSCPSNQAAAAASCRSSRSSVR